MSEQCNVPPTGWRCTRPAGHEGPCAAVPYPPSEYPTMPARIRVWTTPALNGEKCDMVCWQSVEDAMDELAEHGYTFKLGCEELTQEQYDAMFNRDEIVDLGGG